MAASLLGDLAWAEDPQCLGTPLCYQPSDAGGAFQDTYIRCALCYTITADESYNGGQCGDCVADHRGGGRLACLATGGKERMDARRAANLAAWLALRQGRNTSPRASKKRAVEALVAEAVPLEDEIEDSDEDDDAYTRMQLAAVDAEITQVEACLAQLRAKKQALESQLSPAYSPSSPVYDDDA